MAVKLPTKCDQSPAVSVSSGEIAHGLHVAFYLMHNNEHKVKIR